MLMSEFFNFSAGVAFLGLKMEHLIYSFLVQYGDPCQGEFYSGTVCPPFLGYNCSSQISELSYSYCPSHSFTAVHLGPNFY
jgi:hypothetical protein